MTGVVASMSVGHVPVQASVSPPNVFGIGTGSGTVVTNTATVIASGGIGGFTYLWSKVSGDTLTIGASTSAATTFSANPGLGGSKEAVYKCVVTDAAGTTAEVEVEIVIYDGSFA